MFRKEYEVSTIRFASFLRLIVCERRTEMCQSEKGTVIHRTTSCLDIEGDSRGEFNILGGNTIGVKKKFVCNVCLILNG